MELNALTNLLNYRVKVEQQEIGKVADFIVDINKWTLLSFIARRGIWPFTKRYQISIEQLEEIDHERRQLKLSLKLETLEDPTQDQIISMSRSIANFFRWGIYRYRHYYRMPVNRDAVQVRAVYDFHRVSQRVEADSSQTAAIRLKNVIDYQVRTRDKKFIHVKDFVLGFEKNAEKVRYLIFGSRQNKAFLPIEWIESINIQNARMNVLKSQRMLLDGPYSMTI
jgi:hypothetical protein